jgi:hypothetical protein
MVMMLKMIFEMYQVHPVLCTLRELPLPGLILMIPCEERLILILAPAKGEILWIRIPVK